MPFFVHFLVTFPAQSESLKPSVDFNEVGNESVLNHIAMQITCNNMGPSRLVVMTEPISNPYCRRRSTCYRVVTMKSIALL